MAKWTRLMKSLKISKRRSRSNSRSISHRVNKTSLTIPLYMIRRLVRKAEEASLSFKGHPLQSQKTKSSTSRITTAASPLTSRTHQLQTSRAKSYLSRSFRNSICGAILSNALWIHPKAQLTQFFPNHRKRTKRNLTTSTMPVYKSSSG